MQFWPVWPEAVPLFANQLVSNLLHFDNKVWLFWNSRDNYSIWSSFVRNFWKFDSDNGPGHACTDLNLAHPTTRSGIISIDLIMMNEKRFNYFLIRLKKSRIMPPKNGHQSTLWQYSNGEPYVKYRTNGVSDWFKNCCIWEIKFHFLLSIHMVRGVQQS